MNGNWIDRLHGTPEGQRLLERERLILEITELAERGLEQSRMNRADLARALDRSPAFVSKLLNGSNNFTVATLVDLFAVMNQSLHVVAGPLGDSAWISPSNASASFSNSGTSFSQYAYRLATDCFASESPEPEDEFNSLAA
jgi:transcriptional regulator with XRE-family HTH domain